MIEARSFMQSPWRDLLVPLVLLGILLVGSPAWAAPRRGRCTGGRGHAGRASFLAGTGGYEVRVSTSALSPAGHLRDAVAPPRVPALVPYLKHLAILSNPRNDKVLWNRSRCPSCGSGLHGQAHCSEREPTTGRIQVAFVSAPDDGPPAQAPYIRVTAIQGSWTLVPTRARGGTGHVCRGQ